MLSLEQIRRHLIYQFNSQAELLATIKKLWLNFTSDRSRLGEYLQDEKMVSAYTAFYLMSNYQKLKTLFEYAGLDADRFEDYHVYDLGSGPGTFLVAFSELVFGHRGQSFGIESSLMMRKQATHLLSGLGIKNAQIDEKISHRVEGKKLAIFGHSLNEMLTDRAMKYVQQIDADVVVVIEPGTKECFAELLRFRQQILQSGYHCLYPCPTGAACPMESTQDWCHQYMRIDLDPEIATVSQSLHLDRHLQAVSAFIYAKDPNFLNPADKRMVRFYHQTKHSFDWQVCQRQEQHNQLIDVEVSKKGMSKQDVKWAEDIFPGQEVNFDLVKELPNKLRVSLNKF